MSADTPHTGSADSTSRAPWTVLTLLSIAQFMVILDITVVNVALPSIDLDLGFPAGDLQWVVTAYVLMTGGLLLLGGRAADLLGRRTVFLAGLAIFTASSFASGISPTPGSLIAARVGQGIGAALLSPAALSIITTTYAGAQRTTALSVWGAIGAGGAAAGVFFGGLLTEWLGWRWVFFINVPIGLTAAALAFRVIPSSRGEAGSLRDLDLPGALTVVSGLGLLVYAIEGAATHGWGSARTVALLAVSALLLATFAAIEARTASPLVPASTWSSRSLVASAVMMLGASGSLVGAFFLSSPFLQEALGASPLETGVAFLPLVLAVGIAAHAAPHLLSHLGSRLVVAGAMALIATGYALLAAMPSDAAYLIDMLPGFLVLGLGAGLAFVGVSVTAMAQVRHESAGLASGLMTTAHEIGAALGVAIFAAIAIGAGGASHADAALVDGYGSGAMAGAVIAAALVIVALISVPSLRPGGAQAAHVH